MTLTAPKESKLSREEKIALAERRGWRYAYGSLLPPVYDTAGKARGQMPDWMVEAFCCRATFPWAGRLAVDEGTKPKEHLGFTEHLKRFVKIVWDENTNPHFPFQFNPNSSLVFDELFAETPRFLGLAGHKSCVSGDTRILNPITGEQPTIKSLCERGERPMVMTLNGPELAGVPFLKGRETLYEFELSNGGKFKCTANHRLLTPSGWKLAREVSVESVLVGFSPEIKEGRVLSILKLEEADFYDLEVPSAHHYFAEGAIHHNSSKSETLALLCCALFLVNPYKTKCIATSYTIQTGKDKIFGRIKLAWQGAMHFFGGEENMPGRLKDSENKIILRHPTGFMDDTRGIELIPGEQSKSKKSSARLQGIKAEYVFIAADELATLSHAIVKTCKENVATSNDNVWFAGSFNPDNFYDGAMEVAKPIAGWDSITVDSKKWKTNLGECLHFDGLTSPNVIAGEKIWRGLYNREQLMKDKEWYGGEKTHGFWQYIRAFWSPTGSADAIYSGQEIEKYHGDRPCGTGFWWLDKPHKLAGLDPSFRAGGDRAVAYYGELGLAAFEGGAQRMVFEFKDYEILAEDVTKGDDKPLQVANGFREFCEKRGIPRENCGVDCTGAAPFGSLLRSVWGDGFLEITFSESASDAPISDTENAPANERYDNRSAELWYSAKVLLRSQQIKGIHPDMADEMCNRTFKEKTDGKIVIEKKQDMKDRTGKSPDISDAGFCCLDVARQKFDFTSIEKSKKSDDSPSNDEFMRWAEQIQGARCKYLEFEVA